MTFWSWEANLVWLNLYTNYTNAVFLLLYVGIALRLDNKDKSHGGSKTSGIAEAEEHQSLSKDHVLALATTALL